MAATREEETVWFLFSCCSCTLAVKLNIEWQIALLVVKTNMNIINKIASLAALYWVKNFKSSNRYLWLLAGHVGLMTKKIPVDELQSQINGIWRNCNLKNYKQLVTKKPEWFVDQVSQSQLEQGNHKQLLSVWCVGTIFSCLFQWLGRVELFIMQGQYFVSQLFILQSRSFISSVETDRVFFVKLIFYFFG